MCFYSYRLLNKKTPNITKEQEQLAFQKIHQNHSQSAYRAIVLSHAKLVHKIAKQCYGYSRIDIEELISEGNLGLLRAIQSFSLERGLRFSTYATFWIRAYIRQYIRNSFSIVRRTQHNMRTVRERNKKNFETFHVTNNFQIGDISLDKQIGENSADSPLDQLVDERTNAEEFVLLEDQEIKERALFKQAFAQLALKEQEVLQNRYLQDKPKTLQEISLQLKVTHEGVRQIEKRAIKKMQQNVKILQKKPKKPL